MQTTYFNFNQFMFLFVFIYKSKNKCTFGKTVNGKKENTCLHAHVGTWSCCCWCCWRWGRLWLFYLQQPQPAKVPANQWSPKHINLFTHYAIQICVPNSWFISQRYLSLERTQRYQLFGTQIWMKSYVYTNFRLLNIVSLRYYRLNIF